MEQPEHEVLIVENNPARRLDMRAAASAPCRTITDAASPEEALTLLSQRPWDVVVVDVRLRNDDDPRDDSGIGVLKVARSLPDPPPVIVTSSFDDTVSLVDGREVPAEVAAYFEGAFTFVPRYRAFIDPLDLLRLQVTSALSVRALMRDESAGAAQAHTV
jgi:CheY-like chemotaxis protein